MYLSKKPHFGKGKTPNAVRGKRSSFFFFFPFFFFVPGWVENGFWLEGFGGGTRRVVILLFFRWSGVVGYRLVYFLGARGVFRERGKHGGWREAQRREAIGV